MKKMKTSTKVLLAIVLLPLLAYASTKMRDLIITASTIDSSPIGATTPSTGTFTTVTANAYVGLPPSVQTDCRTSVCAGGSTYAYGVTYTNHNTRPVMEEIFLNLTTTGCGDNQAVFSTINGKPGPASGGSNMCGPIPAGLTFIVPPSGTFVITATGGAGAPGVGGWLEVTM